jgi:hypothetical protein
MASPTPPRVPDLHKSAFWIYGVTAMVMREPFSIVLRHAATAGWQDSAVQLEALRALIVLALLSRQFLAAGIYFDRVYLQPDSAERYPRRNYPFDFLFGMGELLLAVAASTVVGTASAIFCALAALILLTDLVWLFVSRALSYATVKKIAPGAVFNGLTLLVVAPLTLLVSEQLGYGILVLATGLHMARLVSTYDKP